MIESIKPVRVGKIRDLTGQKFGLLCVVNLHGRDNNRRVTWLCECECGAKKVVDSRHLVQGKTKSCGCYRNSISANNGKSGANKISGNLSHLYKPELTLEQRTATRNLVANREWKKRVLSQYSFKCDICHTSDGGITAHHLDCWSHFPERRFDDKNGVALCVKHHREFHDFMGGPRQKCTSGDYAEFKYLWSMG